MKTTDSRLIEEIRKEIENGPGKIPISMEYQASAGSPFILIIRDFHKHEVVVKSEEICQKAEKAPLRDEKICHSLQKTGDSAYEVTSVKGKAENIFLPVSAINETRRKGLKQLDERRSMLHTRTGKQQYKVNLNPPDLPEDRILILSDNDIPLIDHSHVYHTGYETGEILPVVNEEMDQMLSLHSCILSSVNDLYHKSENCIAGMTMNIANSYAAAFMLENGCQAIIFSSEMTNAQIKDTLQAFRKRYGFMLCAYRLVYGKRTVMYIKDGFVKDKTLHAMTDMHGNHYEIAYNNGVTTILEPEPYRAENPYCYGSVVILRQDTKHQREILKEAYEEIFQRI